LCPSIGRQKTNQELSLRTPAGAKNSAVSPWCSPIKLKNLTTPISGECLFYKEIPRIFWPIAKYFQYELKSSHISFSAIHKRMPVIGISMSSPTSGFRKWSEAHDPKTPAARVVAGEAAVIPVPDLDQGMMTPEEQPHRPWLVPGAGTL
jgi:hypothetical protein